MKMQYVPLADIVPNPWRDYKLFPIDPAHVADLRRSIKDHGFFGGIKARRRNGKVELGCGHIRFEAAKKEELESIPIFVEDIDDDAMLRLMTDENATQGGDSAGAVINEVGAVIQFLVDGLMADRDRPVPVSVARAFENKTAVEIAKVRLIKRATDSDADVPISYNAIRRYLGQGKEDNSQRSERQIREAIITLKQAGRYDEMIDAALLRHPQEVAESTDDAKPKGKKRKAVKAVTKRKPRKPRILDERCANVFPDTHLFEAFRKAVITPGAQKVLPVSEQFGLAKQIMKEIGDPKKASAIQITKMVQGYVSDALKTQRDVDKKEREENERREVELKIDNVLRDANRSVRSVLSAIAVVGELANKYPKHPKIGGFAARLDQVAAAVREFTKRLK